MGNRIFYWECLIAAESVVFAWDDQIADQTFQNTNSDLQKFTSADRTIFHLWSAIVAGAVAIGTNYYGRLKIFHAYRTFKFRQDLLYYGRHNFIVSRLKTLTLRQLGILLQKR
jgi:hypothetical protein